jgi:hypothetical protein
MATYKTEENLVQFQVLLAKDQLEKLREMAAQKRKGNGARISVGSLLRAATTQFLARHYKGSADSNSNQQADTNSTKPEKPEDFFNE